MELLWSNILKLRKKNPQFALVNVKSFIFCYFRGSRRQFLPLELHKPEVPDSSGEINGWTAPHLSPDRSSSLWVWDLLCGPSCFKTSDDDELGRTLSQVCPPILYIPLHARDLILLTPGLLYALWHRFFFFLILYFDPTCKCFKWRELKAAKKILAPNPQPTSDCWEACLTANPTNMMELCFSVALFYFMSSI